MEITIQFEVDRAQWKRILAIVLRPQLRLSRIAGLVSGAVGLLLVTLSIAMGFELATVSVAVGAVVVGLLLGFGTEHVTVALALRQQADLIYLPTTTRITEDAISGESTAGKVEFVWSAVDGVDDLPDMWLARIGKAQVMPLPKAAFSDADRQTFTEFLASPAMAGRKPATAG